MRCAFGDEDDGVQANAVTHGDHYIAALVVHSVGGRVEGLRRLAGVVGILRRGLRADGSGDEEGEKQEDCGAR